MTDNSIGKTAGGGLPPFLLELAKNAPAMMWTFTATTFLSALLLFAIQPMFAKMALPVLGGSPSVWSVSVFFFQSALLAGYLYAHLLIHKAPPHLTGIIHLAVCAVAFICLPIGIATWVGEPPQGEPYLWQLGMFTASIGLPFMAVSANAPLLQAWFARTGHPNARDPYFMYAASNLGSLIALLGYPIILEPTFGMTELSKYWAYAYALLVLAIATSFFLMRGAQANGVPETAAAPAKDASTPAEAPTVGNRLRWIAFAFVPSALVTAFTVQTTTDVASAPLLWVIPLAVYLLTFVLVFRDRPLISREALLFLHIIALTIVMFALAHAGNHGWLVTSLTGITVLLTTAMLAHRTLYEARPAPQYLTEFYLWMSFGGALGGMFTALVAPKIFSEIYEYPLLLALSMACRPGALSLPSDPEKRKDELAMLWLIAAVGALIVMWLPSLNVPLPPMFARLGPAPFVIAVLAAILLINVRHPARQLVAALLMCLAITSIHSNVRKADSQLTARSFFGVYRVQQDSDPAGTFNVLMHGTTLHGSQRRFDEDGKAVDDTVPTTYYYPGSPIAQSIAKRRELLAAKGEKGRYGIVGLGTGSSSCHKREGETWRFFEIDPTVISIAKNPKNFSFISKCQPDIDIAIGDARLTIAKEPDASFDLFIIDAFNSDAIPVHMLTKEAVQLFLRKLKPDGIVLLHTSNRYLDLNSVLGAILKEIREEQPDVDAITVIDHEASGGYGQSISSNVIFANSSTALQPYRSLPGVGEVDDGGLRAWTDDYSDIWGAFMGGLKRRG
jgi:SAM-dependent methyltransferase